MAAMLEHEGAATRRERRPRGATALFLGAQLDLAATCDGCAALIAEAISHGGRDPDAWVLYLDRACPESTAWWERALASWHGPRADTLRVVLPEVAERATSPIDAAAIARVDPASALVVDAITTLRAEGRSGARAPSDCAIEHALWLSYYQR